MSGSRCVPKVSRITLLKRCRTNLGNIWWNWWTESVRMRWWATNRLLLLLLLLLLVEKHWILVRKLLLSLLCHWWVGCMISRSMTHKRRLWLLHWLLWNHLTHHPIVRNIMTSWKILVRLVMIIIRMLTVVRRLLMKLTTYICRLLS